MSYYKIAKSYFLTQFTMFHHLLTVVATVTIFAYWLATTAKGGVAEGANVMLCYFGMIMKLYWTSKMW